MGENIKNILNRPIYVYLIGVLYLVYKISFVPFNIDAVVVIFLLIFSLITFCSIFIFTRLFKFKYITVVMTAFWIMFLFHIQIMGLFETFIKPPHIVRYKYLWPFILLMGVLLAWLSSMLKKYNSLLNRIANVFFFCSVGVIIINTGFTILSTVNRLNNDYKKHEYLTNLASNKKDIVWLLMDEYSNSSYLQSRFNFKNPMDSLLKNEGFHVFNNIRSRADFTLYSICSIFNFDDSMPPYSFDYGNYSLKHSALPRILKEMNYRFINESFFNIGNKPQIEFATFYNPSLLFKLIDGTILQIYMQHKMYNLYMKIWYPDKAMQSNYNGVVLNSLNLNFKEKYTAPVYFWAHLLIPHDPLYKLRDGKLKYVYFAPADTLANKKAYIDYLSYGNQLVLDLWKANPQLKNKKVIIYGAGDSGYLLIKELLQNHRHELRPIGWIDDDISKHNMFLYGYKIFGGISQLSEICEKSKPDMVLISTNAINKENEDMIKATLASQSISLGRFNISLNYDLA